MIDKDDKCLSKWDKSKTGIDSYTVSRNFNL